MPSRSYDSFSGDRSRLFANGTIDLDALEQGRDALRGVTAALHRSRSELRAVDGDGLLGGETLKKKREGLRQIRSLRTQLAPFTPVIEALPAAVGAEGPAALPRGDHEPRGDARIRRRPC